MAFNPAWWGPKNGIDSKDYMLHMQGATIVDEPISLLGHSLTSPNQNLTTALQFVETVLRNGIVRTVSRTKRPAYETNRTYTVGFPSALWTPYQERVAKEGCQTNLFLFYQCPEDVKFDHVDILMDATANPAIEAEDVVTTGEDTNIITHQSEIQVPQKVREWRVGFDRIYDAGTTSLNDLVILSLDCPGCEFTSGLELAAFGGDGTAVPNRAHTLDRFASVTALTAGTATEIGLAAYNDGDLLVFAEADDTYSAATAGKLFVSADRGATAPTAVAAFTHIIKAFAKLSSSIIAVGKTTAGAGYIAISSDRAVSWSTVSGTVVASLTGKELYDVAVDDKTGYAYIVGADGTLLKARATGSTLTITDISTNHGIATDLLAVAVLGRNHVVIGGTGGECKESLDGGVTWRALSVPGSADITGLAGNIYRLIIGAGTVLYERSILTQNIVKAAVLNDGVTLGGAVTKIRMGLEDNFNQFFVSTAAGEVFAGVGFYPNA